MINYSKNIFVFDVESTNLHGVGFAVGAVVATLDGIILDTFSLMSIDQINNLDTWVKEMVLPSIADMPTCNNLSELRNSFFDFYIKYKDSCEIWSDVNYPVETNFLEAVCNDDFENRKSIMPYPLKDISTLISVEQDRIQLSGLNDLKRHHPVDDCMASLYCLINYYKVNL